MENGRRRFLKLAGAGFISFLFSKLVSDFSYLLPEDVQQELIRTGLNTPLTPEQKEIFFETAESLPNLVHATVYPVNSPMLETIAKTFPRISAYYYPGPTYKFSQIVDLTNANRTWNPNKDGSWADGICLVSTLTVRGLSAAKKRGLIEELNFTPHYPRAHPAAKIRLTNQVMVNEDPILRFKDAGVFYYSYPDRDVLIDLTWQAHKEFMISLNAFDSHGKPLNLKQDFDFSHLTNEEIANLPRDIYFFYVQLFH